MTDVETFKTKHDEVEKAFDLIRQAEQILSKTLDENIEVLTDDLVQGVYEELIEEREILFRKATDKKEIDELASLFP